MLSNIVTFYSLKLTLQVENLDVPHKQYSFHGETIPQKQEIICQPYFLILDL